MANTELNIWLKVRDQASKEIDKTKNKMRSFTDSVKKNWVAIAASIAAVGFAIRKAFDLAQLGAQAEQIESAFSKMATAVGADFNELKRQILDASKSTVNFSNIAAQATVLLGRGVTQSQIIELMKVARVEAQKTGKGVEEAFNQISGAIAGGFLVTVKRNFGLAVDLAGAYEDFSKQTGKSVDAVRKYHAAQALANQVIVAAKMDLAAFNTEMRTNLEHIQSLGAWWTGFKETLGQIILAIIQMVAVMIKTLQAGFAGVIEGLSRVLAATTTGIQKTLEGINKIAKSEAVDAMIQKLRDSSQFMRDFADSEKEVGTEFAVAAGEIASLIGKQNDLTQAQKDAMRSMASELSNSTNDMKDEYNLMHELAKNTATNIQNSFANSFFKAFKGELRSAKDAFAAFGESMLQTISSIIAQIVTYYAIIGPLTKAFPGLEKVFGTFGSFQLGTSYVPQTGMYQLHKGEKVVPESKQGGGGGAQTVNYYIHAADSKSFSEMLHQNRVSVHQIVQENLSRRGMLTHKIRTR